MRTEGMTSSGGAAGGDVKVGHSFKIRQRPPAPPSPTRIRNLTPEQEAEQEQRRKKVSTTRRRIAQKHDYDRRSRQPKTLSDEKIETIVTLYKAGHSASAVSATVGVSKTTTMRYLRESGVKIRGSRKEFPVEELVRAYQRGLSLRELGQLFGMSNTTARARLIEAGVEIRGKGDWRAARAVGASGEDG